MVDLITLDAAAKRLGVHVTTLRAWVRSGRVPAFRLGRRFVRVDWDTLVSVLESEAQEMVERTR